MFEDALDTTMVASAGYFTRDGNMFWEEALNKYIIWTKNDFSY